MRLHPFLLIILVSSCCNAAVVPTKIKGDNRIGHINYTVNDVIKIPVSFGYVTEIQFGNETILTLARGDSKGWSINNTANRIYIKPVLPTMRGAEDTNFNVTTNKRNYVFIASNVPRSEAMFVVRINYPEAPTLKDAQSVRIGSAVSEPTVECSGKYSKLRRKYKNVAYGQSGAAEIPVLDVFDDGEFTFFKLDPRKPAPALYLVNSEGKEELVNTRSECGYLVAEKTNSLFVMRDGKLHKCIRKFQKEGI